VIFVNAPVGARMHAKAAPGSFPPSQVGAPRFVGLPRRHLRLVVRIKAFGIWIKLAGLVVGLDRLSDSIIDYR
jgi:hypothetical protein